MRDSAYSMLHRLVRHRRRDLVLIDDGQVVRGRQALQMSRYLVASRREHGTKTHRDVMRQFDGPSVGVGARNMGNDGHLSLLRGADVPEHSLTIKQQPGWVFDQQVSLAKPNSFGGPLCRYQPP